MARPHEERVSQQADFVLRAEARLAKAEQSEQEVRDELASAERRTSDCKAALARASEMLSQLRLIGPSEAETQAKAAAERKAKADAAVDSKVPGYDEDELMEEPDDGKQRRTGPGPSGAADAAKDLSPQLSPETPIT
eukprot:7776055-Pyramimonas_sp.AAC.1